MDLEEQTLEKPSDRCEVCGATLTAAELAAALETSGPAMCAVHAAEVVAVDEDAPEAVEAD